MSRQPNSISIPAANFGVTIERSTSMARRRYQHPEPEKIGAWWYVRVRLDSYREGKWVRERKRIRLCSAEKKIREVRKFADEYFHKLNKGTQSVSGGAALSDYIDRNYHMVTEELAAPTKACYAGMIERHIRPALGDKCFRELTPLQLQEFFSDLAKRGVPFPTRVKVRDALSSILRSATRLELLDVNPLEKVLMPSDRRGKQKKPVITPEQFNLIIMGIAEPYATMVYVAVRTGLRVSELIGLKWRCIGEASIRIDERYHRGDWACPKSTASAATIAADPEVIERILRLKEITVCYRAGRAVRKVKAVRQSGPDELVFQSIRLGKPMSDGNVLRRHVKPAARALGLGFINWRCLRTSHATWLVQSGADPKSVQGQMRHSRISTTMDIYAQVVPEAQKVAIGKLSHFVAQYVPINGTVVGQNFTDKDGQKDEQRVSIQ